MIPLSGAGRFNNRLVFDSKPIPEARDEYGAPDDDYTSEFEEWGAFEPIGTRSFPSFQKVHEETTARFRIRYRPGITPDKHRIRMIMDYDSSPIVQTIWRIHSPLPVDGQRRELIIEATQIT